MQRIVSLSSLVLLVLVLGAVPSANAQQGDDFAGTVAAPNFPDDLDWFNVPAPLTLDALEGKIVILDFWTYGCINCIHMIPILEQLEEKYHEEIVIIGVHSAKFENEGVSENIRQIIQRYEIVHPVINDHEFRVWGTWRPFGVNAWPTFAVIDPQGNVLAVQAGEIPFDVFDQFLANVVTYWDERGEVNREAVELAPEGADEIGRALAFPGKVLADPISERLFIADTNHNRIVIADLDSYEVLDVIGTGQRGWGDGAFADATFNKPQGMALDGSTLYIADVNNHVIRSADLESRTVETIAGTGEMSRAFNESGAPLEIALRSPWDVELNPDGTLYIAMAGPHQLWVLNAERDFVGPLVGSGREGLLDDSFEMAQLAQPSGLFLRGDDLYWTDSESSSIRVADLANQETLTVAGPLENNLFDFGDIDGVAGVSRLQHALGVTGSAEAGDPVYIADTYNSRIKMIDPDSTETLTLFGTDEHGFRDGDASVAQFYEPGGLDYANGKLYVADTNNHAIRIIDLESSTVSTVTFPNPDRLQIEDDEPVVVGGNAALDTLMTLPEQALAPGDGEIALDILLPEGYKINDLAPSVGEWRADGDALVIAEENHSGTIETTAVRVPVTLSEGSGTLHGTVTIYYCEAINESLCFIDEVSYEIPVAVSADADASAITIEREITPPDIQVGTQLS